MTQSKTSKDQSAFSYEKIHQATADGLRYLQTAVSMGGYSGLLIDAFYEITLDGRPKLKRSPNNFKLHIAIDDTHNKIIMDSNLERGYNIVDQILRNNRVFHYKVVRPGVTMDQDSSKLYQARKQITVYSGEEGSDRSLAEWERVMDEIVLTLADHEVEPRPELIGEQDVRVKGSKYITYRCDNKYSSKPENNTELKLKYTAGNNDELERGFGCPYKDAKEPIDPLQGMRLSDILYKKLFAAAYAGQISITSIIKIIEESVKQDGLRAANIDRVYEHMYRNGNLNIDLAKKQIIIKALIMVQVKKDTTDDISNLISDYEVYTSYSKAAAEYNQLILDVCEKIKENGKLPYWLNGQDYRQYLIAVQWQKVNSQWEVEHKKLINSQPDKVAALTHDTAIEAYKENRAFISSLARCDDIPNQIELLSLTHHASSFVFKAQSETLSDASVMQSMEYSGNTEIQIPAVNLDVDFTIPEHKKV